MKTVEEVLINLLYSQSSSDEQLIELGQLSKTRLLELVKELLKDNDPMNSRHTDFATFTKRDLIIN